jgi:UDPglucose 6-dehydrogenase
MGCLKIGFAGLTHLGINSLAAASAKGCKVVGYDSSCELVNQLNSSNLHINEEGLNELLHKNREHITFTRAIGELASCDLVYISSDVMTDESGVSELQSVEKLIYDVLDTIAESTALVVLCQVPPGFTRKIASFHKNTFYQVETLIFGRAIERALHPERFILGCSDPQRVDKNLWLFLLSFDCPIFPMSFESAELNKTAINLFLAANVSTANTLAELCEAIGADWSDIVPSLRLDKRIGEFAYIETGLGLSGGNIERDLKTISNLSTENEVNSIVVDSFISHSKFRKKWLSRKYKELLQDLSEPKIGVLGLSYKENTHSIKNSPSLDFLALLPNTRVKVYDPIVKKLPDNFNVIHCQDVYSVAAGVDILFINTPWQEFSQLDEEKLILAMRTKIIVDPYKMLSCVFPCVQKYFTLGS